MAELEYKTGRKTVQEIEALYENKKVNLSPGFQRDSVWTATDRKNLIKSILQGYPLPAIFLYKRQAEGELIYDVIDGKQRLESIFMFTGSIRGNRYEVKTALAGSDQTDKFDWKKLKKLQMQHLITGYEIPTIEVDGDFSDIIDLFVRINSTGKALTKQEKRNARYYNSEFLKIADSTARKFEEYFKKNRIVSTSQISRMKHIELICEIFYSVHIGDVINKKSSLDHLMQSGKSGKNLTSNEIRKAKKKTITALNRISKMFPKLKQTRFCKIVDFYTLAVLISKFEDEGLVLTSDKRNIHAQDLLIAFSTNVDEVRELQKKAAGINQNSEIYRDYLSTVQQQTDTALQRKKREKILRSLLQSLFDRKDANRIFSEEQRRIIWNTTNSRKCEMCEKELTWEDFTLDHIKPWTKGGETQLSNAAILCFKCNASKGKRYAKKS
jgi:5-methylcytosine-specific restriction endonuclease McrA